MVRCYGLQTNKEIRNRLIEILYDRVANHKDKFIAPILHHEMSGMEVKKSGKVEHSDTTHDDQVFSYLMAMYVWYDGVNLVENFGLMKTEIKTDDGELMEDIEGGIESEQDNLTKVDLESASMIDTVPEMHETLTFVREASKYQSTKEFTEREYNKEQDMFDYLLATNKAARDSYNKKYNLQSSHIDQVGLVSLPTSIFLDGDEEDWQKEQELELHGNLYDDFKNL